MAGNGYVTKGYTTYNEIEPTYQGIVCNDHVCRPVIVDAQGRKRPIVRYTDTTSGYATRTPEYTSHGERIQTPDFTTTKTPEYTSNNYGGLVNYDKWGRQSISPQKKFDHEVITKGTNTNYWQTTTPTPTYTHGHYPNTMASGLYENEWPKSNHPLTTTTNDIGEAVDFLKHAITTESPHAQPWVHKRESYVVAETMDSREAARRYARPVFKQPPSLGY